MNTPRSRSGGSARSGTPQSLPEGTPSHISPHDHSFTLQAVMEMKGSVGELTAKTERLIADVKTQSDKVSELRDTLIWLKGGMAVLGLIGIVIGPFLTWFLNHNYPASAPTPTAVSAPAQPAAAPITRPAANTPSTGG